MNRLLCFAMSVSVAFAVGPSLAGEARVGLDSPDAHITDQQIDDLARLKSTNICITQTVPAGYIIDGYVHGDSNCLSTGSTPNAKSIRLPNAPFDDICAQSSIPAGYVQVGGYHANRCWPWLSPALPGTISVYRIQKL